MIAFTKKRSLKRNFVENVQYTKRSLKAARGVVALNSELEEVRKMVLRWFEGYKEVGDEMSVEMFIDDLEVVERYVAALYYNGTISGEEYMRFLTFCDSLVDELKSVAGIERIDTRFR